MSGKISTPPIEREPLKPVYAREHIGEQVGYFEDMSQADQIALLREAVENRAALPSSP